jgi:hypothetical protein
VGVHWGDFGLSAHKDKTGTPCVYCGEPSVQTLVVDPPRGRAKLLETRVGLCATHRREPEKPAPSHRSRAQGFEQTAMDVGDA